MAPGQLKCPHCGAQSSSSASLCYSCNGDLRAAPSAGTAAVTATAMATGGTVEYDPGIIHGYAKHLYARASLITAVYALIGAVVTAPAFGLFGAATGSSEAGLLLGALIGGAIGYFVGNMKANALRLEAQLALCQVEIEKNTRVG